jgi:hypothetical protein
MNLISILLLVISKFFFHFETFPKLFAIEKWFLYKFVAYFGFMKCHVHIAYLGLPVSNKSQISVPTCEKISALFFTIFTFSPTN